MEPAAKTRDLYAQIMAGEKPIPAAALLEEAAGPAPAPGSPPFKGLQYYDQKDTDLFFGRESLTSRLVAQLTSTNFLAVVGASGSGKSSLLRAGLVPALRRGGPLSDGTSPPLGSENWLIHVIEPTAHPLESLSIGLTRDTEPIKVAAGLVDDMGADWRSLHLYATRKLNQIPPGEKSIHKDRRLVLVIDQFEELFTLCHSELRAAGIRGEFDDCHRARGTNRSHHCAARSFLRPLWRIQVLTGGIGTRASIYWIHE